MAEIVRERARVKREQVELWDNNDRVFRKPKRSKAVEVPVAPPRPQDFALGDGHGPGRGTGCAQGEGRPAGCTGTGAQGESRVAGRTKTLENLGNLAASDVVLQSQARDTDLQQATAKDDLEEYQMSRAVANWGELEDELEEKDVRLERDGHRIK